MKNKQLKSLIQLPASPILVLVICLSLFTNFALGQTRTSRSTSKADAAAPNALVTPIFFGGQDVTCAQLNASTAPEFSHITEDSQIKFMRSSIDSDAPFGTFTFTSDPTNVFARTVVGPEDATRSITFSSANDAARVNSFSSQRQITAVNVKVGTDSYVYPYSPFVFSDTNLNTGDPRDIIHVTFCFGLPGNPTAGDGAISGRVVNSNGAGISNARMTLVDAATGETVSALTNGFGFYTIDNIAVGGFYTLSVSHKRYRFADPIKAISLSDSLTNVDFVANP